MNVQGVREFQAAWLTLSATVTHDMRRLALQVAALARALDQGEAWVALSTEYARSEFCLPERDEDGRLVPEFLSRELQASLSFLELVGRVVELGTMVGADG